jgi:hypothetical protein
MDHRLNLGYVGNPARHPDTYAFEDFKNLKIFLLAQVFFIRGQTPLINPPNQKILDQTFF